MSQYRNVDKCSVAGNLYILNSGPQLETPYNYIVVSEPAALVHGVMEGEGA